MPALYEASVPVFRHYLARSRALVLHPGTTPEVLGARLAPDMFTAAQQFATAAAFALRTACPLAGVPVPEFGDLGMDAAGLAARIDLADRHLASLPAEAFEGAETRRIRHLAGFADLDQTGAEFLHLFGMPNFMFHLSMAFAILRQNGVGIGKADFDAQHDYPPGFRF